MAGLFDPRSVLGQYALRASGAMPIDPRDNLGSMPSPYTQRTPRVTTPRPPEAPVVPSFLSHGRIGEGPSSQAPLLPGMGAVPSGVPDWYRGSPEEFERLQKAIRQVRNKREGTLGPSNLTDIPPDTSIPLPTDEEGVPDWYMGSPEELKKLREAADTRRRQREAAPKGQPDVIADAIPVEKTAPTFPEDPNIDEALAKDAEDDSLFSKDQKKFIMELGLRLMASNNPAFLGALGEASLGTLQSKQAQDERALQQEITAKREERADKYLGLQEESVRRAETKVISTETDESGNVYQVRADGSADLIEIDGQPLKKAVKDPAEQAIVKSAFDGAFFETQDATVATQTAVEALEQYRKSKKKAPKTVSYTIE